ncbi:MAG: type II toxin-antitoxin system ParD family antitoxin [Calothrix sp. SM1_7_51]|nr:type II toxin-antitoxin system ParD family antitoxin [Calothrix sp. SM1_7_51]
MNVSLTPELEKFVHEKVDGGLYNSASEVIREALRLLREHDMLRQCKLDELKHEISLGLEQANSGQTKTFDAEAMKLRVMKTVSPEM